MERYKSLVVAAVAACLLIPAVAWGHDVIVPPWRDQPGATFQHWTFDDGDNPANPEVIRNPYGSAVANITVGDYGSGWLDQLPNEGTPTGYWDLGSEGTIVLDIANRPPALEYKEIWVQVMYLQEFMMAPSTVEIPGAVYLGGQKISIEETAPPSGWWYVEQSMWRIEPNPPAERITIRADVDGSLIDQIVVDTICIPEPTTMGLLSLAGAAMLLRRRSQA